MLSRIVVAFLSLLVAGRLEAKQPNIVLIYLDDAAYNEFGFTSEQTGEPTLFETPRIDALARQSTVVTNGYCSYPVCSPSRAGLLTGVHQARFGFEYNVSDGAYPDGLTGDPRIMPSYLSELGYSSAAMGKWHLGAHDGLNRPLDLGFDEFYGFLSGGRSYWQYNGNLTNAYAMRRGDTPIETTWASEGDSTLYDPVRGRYVTDALGEEAADFITRRAQTQEPFFLYLALSAPHVPLDVKQADLDHFAHIPDLKQRKLAAMTYAADRAVGNVLDALQASGVDQETVVVLANDNGGSTPYDNDPYRGGKGQLSEGGIRVPFIMRVPGIEPGVYDRPVSTLDMLPTFVDLAGGRTEDLQTDGINVVPFLKGERSGDPHEILHWRSAGNRFAVRRGDWKLTRPEGGTGAPRLFNLASDPGETTNLASQQPDIVAQLRRELAHWEAQLEKPHWGSFGLPTANLFDHFVYRHETAAEGDWSASHQWRQVTGEPETLSREDAYANAVLEFQTSNNRSYVATNDMKRATLETFMLNEIRLTGFYSGRTDGHALINGNDLLFVKNLDGQAPRISLSATANSSAGLFQFQIDNDLQLLEDLEIGGDGTQVLEISGSIMDYDSPRGLRKTGTSRVRLSGDNTYGGNTTIEAGAVTIATPFLADAANIRLFSGGTLDLDFSGTDAVNALYIDGAPQLPGIWGASGNLAADFHSPFLTGGGLLLVTSEGLPGDFNGDNAVNAADYVTWRKGLGPGYQPQGYDRWQADFGQTSAELPSDLNDDGSVDAADYVLWRKGVSLPYDEDDYGQWSGNYGSSTAALPGDFNQDGSVDAADYVVWRKGLGGDYDQADYDDWLASFGTSSGEAASRAAVPEPSLSLLLLSLLGTLAFSRRYGRLERTYSAAYSGIAISPTTSGTVYALLGAIAPPKATP